jgi:uncharacterized phosphosugar-binding protein
MSESAATPGPAYLATIERLIRRLGTDEWPNLSAAADLLVGAIGSGHSVHAFGTGHSHMLAEELYYRAGGLVRVRPILFEGLMLHSSATLSTSLERLPGLAAALLDDHAVEAGDVVIVASNSGSNAVTSEIVSGIQARGAKVVAITSLTHATSSAARDSGRPRLHELADVVIDNGGVVGDAAVDIDGFDQRVAPTSTVVGAAIINAVVAETVQRLVAAGHHPEVYTSSNLSGGDAANSRFGTSVGA